MRPLFENDVGRLVMQTLSLYCIDYIILHWNNYIVDSTTQSIIIMPIKPNKVIKHVWRLSISLKKKKITSALKFENHVSRIVFLRFLTAVVVLINSIFIFYFHSSSTLYLGLMPNNLQSTSYYWFYYYYCNRWHSAA